MQQGRNNRRPRGPWNTQDQARQLDYSGGAGSIAPQSSTEHNRSEPNSWKELKKELEEAREQVARQKNLKEVFIKKEKATRAELERLKRASDPETMTTMSIATEARSTIKTKKKKELQNDFEALKVAHIISQQKFSAELELERETNVTKLQAEEEISQGLRKELTQLKQEHQDKVREQEKDKEALEKEMEELKAKLQSAETLSCCQEEKVKQLTSELQTKTDSLQKQVETNKLLQEKNSSLHEEVRELKVAHVICQEKFSAEIQVEKDESKALQQELEKLKLSNLINLRYETELEAEKEKSDSLQKQLDKETQAKAEKAKDDLEATKQLMAEKKSLEEEIRTLKTMI